MKGARVASDKQVVQTVHSQSKARVTVIVNVAVGLRALAALHCPESVCHGCKIKWEGITQAQFY